MHWFIKKAELPTQNPQTAGASIMVELAIANTAQSSIHLTKNASLHEAKNSAFIRNGAADPESTAALMKKPIGRNEVDSSTDFQFSTGEITIHVSCLYQHVPSHEDDQVTATRTCPTRVERALCTLCFGVLIAGVILASAKFDGLWLLCFVGMSLTAAVTYIRTVQGRVSDNADR